LNIDDFDRMSVRSKFFFGEVMAIKPILSSLLIGPMTASVSAGPTTVHESAIPANNGSALRKMQFKYAYQPNLMALEQAEIPMGRWVGELQERWQFPSDHLPIGMTIDDLHIASWNILNSEYMGWVFKNSQGLSRSLLTQEHIYLEGSKLTYRDLHVLASIKSMLVHPTHPRSAISLQECSAPMVEELLRHLPEDYGVVLSSQTAVKDQNVVIYDKRVFDYDPSRSQIVGGIFSKDTRTVMNVCFVRKDTHEAIRVVNAHLPGEPGNPAPAEFAAYVAYLANSNALIIAMGDMNFNEVEMKTEFAKRAPQGFQFDMLAPYCTNISLDFCSKSIDHFFIYAQDKHAICENTPEDVMPGLSNTVQFLANLL
jgi:hypothetical protein